MDCIYAEVFNSSWPLTHMWLDFQNEAGYTFVMPQKGSFFRCWEGDFLCENCFVLVKCLCHARRNSKLIISRNQ